MADKKFDWDRKKNQACITVDTYNPIFDLANDRVVLAIEEQLEDSDPGDLRRESLRINENGAYYLHTNSDWDEEQIITDSVTIDKWKELHGIK